MARFLLVALLVQLGTIFAADSNTLLEEKFEDSNFAARGWYDGSGPPLSSAEHIPGSTKSAEYHWIVGSSIPKNTGPFRRKFTPSEAVYISYWVKYSSNYTGSNRPYHPHEFVMLTTKNADYAGPAYTHLTGYVEQNEGTPALAIQDGQNVDETQIGQDLTLITENRSVAGCNGNGPDGYSGIDCYRSGNVHWNGKVWKASQIYFQDTPGAYYKADWHKIEAYFKLNSISDGKGLLDGQLRYWYDGALIIEHTNVLMRTGANSDMRWNQFLVAPYIGDGSPVDQTMWIDDLRISAARILADNDNDQITDDWEVANRLNPKDPADALQDFDTDHFTNFAEYLAGTDPFDPDSLLKITAITLHSTGLAIRFNTVPGKNYELEFTTDLSKLSWLPLASSIIGTGTAVEITDDPLSSPSSRFYRLKL